MVYRLVYTFCHPSLTSYGVSYFLTSYSLWPAPFGGWALLDCGFFFLQSTLLLFSTILLPFPIVPLYYSCCDVIWPNLAGPIWACRFFFLQWLSMIIGPFITLLASSSVPFASYWASLTHLLSLGFLGPFPNSAFSWVFTNFSGHSWPNYLIPHHWGSWACHQLFTFFTFITSGLLWFIFTFLHHILPMGLLLLSFWAPLGPSTSSRPICSFHGPAIHNFCHLGLMVFLSTY